MAVTQWAFSVCSQRGNCYFILFPTVEVKGVVDCISVDGYRVPFVFSCWYFSVVDIVPHNWAGPFYERLPSDNNSTSYYFLDLVYDYRDT